MALSYLTSPRAVLRAISEFDRLGRDAFLAKYGFREARSYYLVHEGRRYDSKAIVAAAYGYQYPDEGPLGNVFSGGDKTVRARLEKLGFRVEGPEIGLAVVTGERERREEMWAALSAAGDPSNVTNAHIAKAGVRPGNTGQGIFRDHTTTRPVAPPEGVTVALLAVDDAYSDAFDETGGIYHYPATKRGGRDDGEIEATKNAWRLRLPLFVITPGRDTGRRRVRKAWIEDFDDEARQFLVTFGREQPEVRHEPSADDDEPIELIVKRPVKLVTAKARPGQARFRFNVFKRYGAACALCAVTAEALLEAVHIVPVEVGGTDDPRNALVMCRNHHRAFDAELIRFDPKSLNVVAADGGDLAALGVQRMNLAHLPAAVAPEALKWRRDDGPSRARTQ